MLKNGKPDSVTEGQGLDLKLTRDPSAAKGQPSLTLGWESTPHTALGSAVSHWGRGQSWRSGAPQGSCGHTHGLSARRSQQGSHQPLPCRQLPPGPESTERSVHRGGSHQQWAQLCGNRHAYSTDHPPHSPAPSTLCTGTSFWNRALLFPGIQPQAPAGLLSSLTA